jgi:hypothetical protein
MDIVADPGLHVVVEEGPYSGYALVHAFREAPTVRTPPLPSFLSGGRCPPSHQRRGLRIREVDIGPTKATDTSGNAAGWTSPVGQLCTPFRRAASSDVRERWPTRGGSCSMTSVTLPPFGGSTDRLGAVME